MAESRHPGSAKTLLLAATRATVVPSRMAIRFSQAGCRVSATYPSKAYPLASTQAVESHHHYSMVDPLQSLLAALRASGAELVVPCDGLAVRHLHALYAMLPATEDSAKAAEVIQRSLGDPTAYLLIDSRHEVQTAARSEGLNAAESFAIGRATDPETIAQVLPFPWVIKADYVSGGESVKVVHSMAEARSFIRRVGAPPSLAIVLRQLAVDSDRAALGEWLHAMRPGLSAQRPVDGTRAGTVASCWHGEVLALISAEIVSPRDLTQPPAVVRTIDSPPMEQTVRRLTQKLGLSGFHEFNFVFESSSGLASLIEINPFCTEPSHLNTGPGHDLVDAFCRRWLDAPPERQSQVHADPLVAYFPQAWVANPSDPLLNTTAYDAPLEDPRLMKRISQMVRRGQRFQAIRSGLGPVFRLVDKG
jgi:hypothetical protein